MDLRKLFKWGQPRKATMGYRIHQEQSPLTCQSRRNVIDRRGWRASPRGCTWVWVGSGSWWPTGKPGVLQFMGSQRVGYDWLDRTGLNWTECNFKVSEKLREIFTLNYSIKYKTIQHLFKDYWIFIGRTDAEAETPILWPPDVKSWLIWKDPYAGKDWRWEKRKTEDETVGWHHRLNKHEFAQTLGDSKRLGSLACCGSWGLKESEAWLSNWTTNS